MKLLVEALDQGCWFCHSALQLRDIIHESTSGLASLLHLKCWRCSKINKVPTGKRHHDASKGRTRPVFDVNTKAAAGSYHSCTNFGKYPNFFWLYVIWMTNFVSTVFQPGLMFYLIWIIRLFIW